MPQKCRRKRGMIVVDEREPVGELPPPFPARNVEVKEDEDVRKFYDLNKEIGRGRFGTVYQVTDKGTGQKFAAKFVNTRRNQDRANAEREVEIMKLLNSERPHPRLIQLYDAFDMDKEMCLVLEIVDGGELFERVIDDDFVLTERACAIFMRQICEGVEFIHSKNILHLDMKPENILCLSREGNRVKICDFGLARKYDPRKKLQVLFGTPEFVAPEVVNFEPISFGTDMWSVGVICYVLLSGLSPFMGHNYVETMTNVTHNKYDFSDEAFERVSDEAKDFIQKLLVLDKSLRLTPAQCLRHAWLKRPPPASTFSSSLPQSEDEDEEESDEDEDEDSEELSIEEKIIKEQRENQKKRQLEGVIRQTNAKLKEIEMVKQQLKKEELEKQKRRQEDLAKEKLKEEEHSRQKLKEEEEERTKKRLQEEEAAKQKLREEELARKKLKEEELARQKKLKEEEQTKKRLKEEELARQKLKEEETKKRLKEEEQARQKLKEEQTKKRLKEEEAAKQKQREEELARKKLQEEELARQKRKEDELARKKLEEKEVAKQKLKEEEQAKQKLKEKELEKKKAKEKELKIQIQTNKKDQELQRTKSNLKEFVERWNSHPNSPYLVGTPIPLDLQRLVQASGGWDSRASFDSVIVAPPSDPSDISDLDDDLMNKEDFIHYTIEPHKPVIKKQLSPEEVAKELEIKLSILQKDVNMNTCKEAAEKMEDKSEKMEKGGNEMVKKHGEKPVQVENIRNFRDTLKRPEGSRHMSEAETEKRKKAYAERKKLSSKDNNSMDKTKDLKIDTPESKSLDRTKKPDEKLIPNGPIASQDELNAKAVAKGRQAEIHKKKVNRNNNVTDEADRQTEPYEPIRVHTIDSERHKKEYEEYLKMVNEANQNKDEERRNEQKAHKALADPAKDKEKENKKSPTVNKRVNEALSTNKRKTPEATTCGTSIQNPKDKTEVQPKVQSTKLNEKQKEENKKAYEEYKKLVNDEHKKLEEQRKNSEKTKQVSEFLKSLDIKEINLPQGNKDATKKSEDGLKEGDMQIRNTQKTENLPKEPLKRPEIIALQQEELGGGVPRQRKKSIVHLELSGESLSPDKTSRSTPPVSPGGRDGTYSPKYERNDSQDTVSSSRASTPTKQLRKQPSRDVPYQFKSEKDDRGGTPLRQRPSRDVPIPSISVIDKDDPSTKTTHRSRPATPESPKRLSRMPSHEERPPSRESDRGTRSGTPANRRPSRDVPLAPTQLERLSAAASAANSPDLATEQPMAWPDLIVVPQGHEAEECQDYKNSLDVPVATLVKSASGTLLSVPGVTITAETVTSAKLAQNSEGKCVEDIEMKAEDTYVANNKLVAWILDIGNTQNKCTTVPHSTSTSERVSEWESRDTSPRRSERSVSRDKSPQPRAKSPLLGNQQGSRSPCNPLSREPSSVSLKTGTSPEGPCIQTPWGTLKRSPSRSNLSESSSSEIPPMKQKLMTKSEASSQCSKTDDSISNRSPSPRLRANQSSIKQDHTEVQETKTSQECPQLTCEIPRKSPEGSYRRYDLHYKDSHNATDGKSNTLPRSLKLNKQKSSDAINHLVCSTLDKKKDVIKPDEAGNTDSLKRKSKFPSSPNQKKFGPLLFSAQDRISQFEQSKPPTRGPPRAITRTRSNVVFSKSYEKPEKPSFITPKSIPEDRLSCEDTMSTIDPPMVSSKLQSTHVGFARRRLLEKVEKSTPAPPPDQTQNADAMNNNTVGIIRRSATVANKLDRLPHTAYTTHSTKYT